MVEVPPRSQSSAVSVSLAVCRLLLLSPLIRMTMQLGMHANTPPPLAALTSALEQKASWPQICIGDFFPAPGSHTRAPPHTQLKKRQVTQ